MKTEIFNARDGKAISLKVWDEVESPKGVVQIIHGMAEHITRYCDFAEYLNRNGYIVVGDDHRAHGDTDPDALGLAGDGDLFEKTVEDERGITELLKSRYSLPIVVLGHSYGSFLTQRYLTLGADGIDACILMGSAAMEGAIVKLGRSVAAGRVKRGKKDEEGRFFADQTFVKYDKKLGEGTNAWLCRDKAQVQKFNADPQCGFVCSNGFYYHFFGGLLTIAKDKGERIRKDLPLLLISGTADGVGGYGKLVRKLHARYTKFGLKPELRLIDGARHEVLNEIDKESTYELIGDFIERILK